MSTTNDMQMQETTAEQQEDLRFALGLKRGVCYKLNLGDPLQHRYAVNMLKLAGQTPENAPQTFAMFETARIVAETGPPVAAEFANDGGDTITNLVPYNTILSFGTPDQQIYTGTALSSIPGGSAKTTILLTLTAVDDQARIANVSQDQYAGGTNFSLQASGFLPSADPTKEVVALATFYIYQGSSPIPTVYTQSADDAGTPTAACQNAPTYKAQQAPTTCVNSGTVTPALIACWNRTPGNVADCDYYQVAGQPATFDFPVIGSLTFSDPIASPITGMFILALQPTSGGAAIVSNLNAQNPSQPLPANFKIGTTPNQVTWNFPASSFPNNHSLTTGGAMCNYTCFVSVALNSATVNTGSGTFTSDSTLWQNPGTYPVPQIDILYGCVAEGTMIRMADGTEMPVERFDGGGRESVLSGNGVKPVMGTTRGKEVPPIIIIRTDRGHELSLTEEHPLPVGAKVVLAKYLAVGMRVTTTDGEATLTAVERQPYAGDVWNLKIGTTAEAARGETTMYANGILVGDLHMQRHFGELDRFRRVENPLDALPAEWHEEYRNWAARSGAGTAPRKDAEMAAPLTDHHLA